jgi:hypothetical protein
MKALKHLLILSAIFCSGCIPYHYTLQPGATGTVVDSKSGCPLPDAQVILSSIHGTWDPTNNIDVFFTNQVASTTSTNNGTFHIPPKREWSVLIFIPIDFPWKRYELRVENTNYQTLKFRFTSFPLDTGKQASTNFGVIKLPVGHQFAN